MSDTEAISAAMTEVRELAVLTVYVVRDDADAALLEIQLDRLLRHTPVPVSVLAAAPRAPESVMARLREHPHVTLIDTPPCPELGSREHAHHLDHLLTAASTTSATHVATFDLDSFPIADDWLERIDTDQANWPVAGILRSENNDVCLPHPSCTVISRDFLERHPVSFSPDSDGTPEFRRFLHQTGQAGDTGIRLAYTLWRDRVAWARMTRTNVVDLHPIIAGIYADSVFHLGAGSRPAIFRRDLATSPVHRVTDPLERLPVGSGKIRDAKRGLLKTLRGPAERQIVERNRRAALEARDWLLRDLGGLLAYLRGR